MASWRLAVWQTGLGGLDWLDEHASADRIIKLCGNGYSIRYTGRAKELLPHITDKPPAARDIWLHDPGIILTDEWVGQTTFD
ncbi:MAG: hypothetical protein WCJ63_04190 [Actinomycetes bacterium]